MFDVAVIGGGMVGAAIAYGCAARGARTVMLDEGDTAYRAARANAGLIFSQGKGEGSPAYAAWTRASIGLWPRLADALSLAGETPIGFRHLGVVSFCLGEQELEERRALVRRMHNQVGGPAAPVRLLDRGDLRALMPRAALGSEVAGGSYSPEDGDVNPLLLLRGLHAGFRKAGGTHLPGRTVERVRAEADGFSLTTQTETLRAAKVVVACGLGIPRLAAMLEMAVAVHPVRGQMIITERMAPLLDLPSSGVRQTVEGSVQIGTTFEEGVAEPATRVEDLTRIAARAVRILPALASTNVIRAWAGLRPMTPDGSPVYAQSSAYPGAFAAVCHSGVTLAAAHAGPLAASILAGRLADGLAELTPERFAVPPD
ncbi:MAG: FAD-dependent oxidoreductase [Acetobacteraceae bacterium]